MATAGKWNIACNTYINNDAQKRGHLYYSKEHAFNCA